jgi:hypothetical protein
MKNLYPGDYRTANSIGHCCWYGVIYRCGANFGLLLLGCSPNGYFPVILCLENIGMVKTHKVRINRPDGRGQSAARKAAVGRRVAAKQDISDLRTTRVQAKDRKVRTIDIDAMPLRKERIAKTEDDKLLRALRKKLRSMEPLIVKQKAGGLLDEAQLAKLEGLDEIIADLAGVAEKISIDSIDKSSDNAPTSSNKNRPVKQGAKSVKRITPKNKIPFDKSSKKSYPVAENERDGGYYNSGTDSN